LTPKNLAGLHSLNSPVLGERYHIIFKAIVCLFVLTSSLSKRDPSA